MAAMPWGRSKRLPDHQPMLAPKLHYTLLTSHYTLHTTHYTLHTTHYTLHTTHDTLHTTHDTLNQVHDSPTIGASGEAGPLSSELLGTHKTVKAGFWPLLSDKSP